MRLTPLGKLVLFILIVGVAVGGWRWWQNQSAGGTDGGTVAARNETRDAPGDNKGLWDRIREMIPATGNKGGGSSPSGTGGGSGNPGDILLVTTPAKAGWLNDMVEQFNAKHQGKYRVVLYKSEDGKTGMASRNAMKAILAGNLKPVLWSPGNPMITARLGEVWAQQRGGEPVIDMADPNGYRVFLRSPMVFLTTKEKAKFLRPILSGPNPWSALREVSMGRKPPPWGRLKFSHADPQTSSSGIATLGLILNEYAQKTGQTGDMHKLAISAGFQQFLSQVEQGLVYDQPAINGTTALTRAFLADPTRYDLITAYEGTALKSAEQNPNIYVMYPNPTSVSEHAVSLLNAPWISDRQREGALEFIKFLGSRDAIQAGLKDMFRPVAETGDLTLRPALARYSDNGFQATFTTTELPPYEAINDASYLWAKRIAPHH
ncbi:MAG: substrate-binding domain-containing protein [Armatimonadetes bacterium]|nr:substrate-binding domain-containing protein [Armatimonadota bacterium]